MAKKKKGQKTDSAKVLDRYLEPISKPTHKLRREWNEYKAAHSKASNPLFFFLAASKPMEAFKKEREDYKGKHPGFINVVVHFILAIHTLLSVHHLFQSTFDQRRYLATDTYFTGWVLFAVAVGLCDVGVVSRCAPILFPGLVFWLVVYRLFEILPREIWIIFYRNKALTATSRVFVVAVLNYATITGLFGYLHGPGGFKNAIEISLTFSANADMSGLEILQAAYCFGFAVIILAVFIARVQPKSLD